MRTTLFLREKRSVLIRRAISQTAKRKTSARNSIRISIRDLQAAERASRQDALTTSWQHRSAETAKDGYPLWLRLKRATSRAVSRSTARFFKSARLSRATL